MKLSIHTAGHIFTGQGSKVYKCRARIFIWAWFSESGAGDIQLMDENCSEEEFIQMLDRSLVPVSWARFGLKKVDFLFNQSNNLTLKSSVVRNWFQEHQEFKPESLPTKSYDLNPFCSVWHEFER